MELESIIGLVERIGVPIVCLGFCGWYIRYLSDQFQSERHQMREQELQNDSQLIELVKASSDALVELKTALAEQTITMRELLGKLDKRRCSCGWRYSGA